MDPITVIAVINGSMSLVKSLLPVIDQMVQSGEITPAQQAEARAAYESLKAQADGQFQGPHWQIDP